MDDAAIVRPEGSTRALVLTVDVITPIVDDARDFGGIAAANALSDVYAMGGQPEVALSFVGFPNDELPTESLHELLAGLHDTCARAGCAIVGGHTIADTEPKCGLTVVGSVDPDRVWSHRSARAGGVLVLTKPLGTGLIGHAVRAGTAPPELVARMTKQMLMLNDEACRVGLELGASACTDITGFGLLGHLRHLVEASGLSALVRSADVPALEGALGFAESDCIPGGTKRNLRYAEAVTRFADSVAEPVRILLADAQTSGGLLLCLAPERASKAVRALRLGGCTDAAIVGELRAAPAPNIEVA
jgi:selenide, water dikinase